MAIQFNGRSGSYLLSNLFDNANEVISCPPDSFGNPWGIHRFVLVGERCRIINEGVEPKLISKNIAQRIINKFPNLFHRTDEINGTIGVDRHHFQEILQELLLQYINSFRISSEDSTFGLLLQYLRLPIWHMQSQRQRY